MVTQKSRVLNRDTCISSAKVAVIAANTRMLKRVLRSMTRSAASVELATSPGAG